jgi:hypothetical protein
MAEAGQIDRIVDQLAADQAAAARQLELRRCGEVVHRQLEFGLRRVRPGAAHGVVGLHQEDEAGAERVSRAHQVAEVHRLADALGPDREKSAQGGLRHPRLLGGPFATVQLLTSGQVL